MENEWIENIKKENLKLNQFLEANPDLPREVYFVIKQRCIDLDKAIMLAMAKEVSGEE
ncbi:hypothetical protein LSPCS325_53680 [Lysinibacillus sp. CTST325]